MCHITLVFSFETYGFFFFFVLGLFLLVCFFVCLGFGFLHVFCLFWVFLFGWLGVLGFCCCWGHFFVCLSFGDLGSFTCFVDWLLC